MIIENYRLNKTNGGTNFSYNDSAEDAIVDALCSNFNLADNGGPAGYAPEFDRIINNTKVEIKIQSCSSPFIEISKFDGKTPSGISLTESDLYLVVNPAGETMKMRLFYTKELKNWVERMLEKHPEKLEPRKPDNLGPGSCGFFLDFESMKTLNDLFVLGFESVRDEDNRIIFDTADIITRNTNFARNNIKNYIP